jgi:hypothetical protein
MQSNAMFSKNIFQRILLSGLTAVALTGCIKSQALVNAYDAVIITVAGLPDTNITRDSISKIPYASISAKIGKGPRSLLILSQKTREELHWISADRAVIVTQNGRVIKTYGFPENMRQTHLEGKDPVNRKLHTLKKSTQFKRSIDIDKGNKFGTQISSSFRVIGSRTITIAEIEIKTVLVVERNTAKTINWSFTNYYWADSYDGFIWKTRQHIAPSFDPVDIEFLKPAT